MRERPTPTRKNVPMPCLMVVGLSDDLADAIADQMDPIPVIRVGHLAAASERILTTRPLVVVVGELGAAKDDLDPFRELARACGTEVARLEDIGPIPDVPRHVEQLVITFSRRRSGQFVAVETKKTPPKKG
jgi:hypothetical protein